MIDIELVKIEQASIPFVWKDPEYGRAEFAICLVYKYGKLREFYVSHLQQRDIKRYWKCEAGYHHDFSISSYHGLNEAKAWLFGWCKEHKCPFFRLYVPNDANYINIDHNGISFTKTSWYSTILEAK